MDNHRNPSPVNHHAYVQGQRAFLRYNGLGEGAITAPYPEGTVAHANFWLGWYDERDDLRAIKLAKGW